MKKISQTLSCNLTVYKSKNNNILSIKVTAIDNIKLIISYFNKYPLGIKNKDFKDWEIVFYMIISKQHLTETARSKIKLIQSSLNSKRVWENKGLFTLNSQIFSPILIIILISFILLNIPYIINSDFFIPKIKTDYLISMVDDPQ